MWGLFFVPAFLEMLALISSIICATWGCVRLFKIIRYKDWKDHSTSKLLLPLIALFTMAALLYYVWVTQMIFSWKVFSFAMI